MLDQRGGDFGFSVSLVLSWVIILDVGHPSLGYRDRPPPIPCYHRIGGEGRGGWDGAPFDLVQESSRAEALKSKKNKTELGNNNQK